MTDMTERPATPDAHLILLQQISQTLVGHGEKLDKAKDEQHAVKETLAALNERIVPLLDLPRRLTEIELRNGQQEVRITGTQTSIRDHEGRLAKLEASANQQQGWQGPLGKVGYAFIAAVAAAIVAFIVGRNVKAAELPTDLRLDNAANAKCWAAPATRAPKHMFL